MCDSLTEEIRSINTCMFRMFVIIYVHANALAAPRPQVSFSRFEFFQVCFSFFRWTYGFFWDQTPWRRLFSLKHLVCCWLRWKHAGKRLQLCRPTVPKCFFFISQMAFFLIYPAGPFAFFGCWWCNQHYVWGCLTQPDCCLACCFSLSISLFSRQRRREPRSRKLIQFLTELRDSPAGS